VNCIVWACPDNHSTGCKWPGTENVK